MTYFVTGATGFVGKFLLANLLRRDNGKAGSIYVLVRKQSVKNSTRPSHGGDSTRKRKGASCQLWVIWRSQN